MACKVLQFHPTEDRIVIDTGCKIFDRQCTYLAQGNHWGNCQFSSYVRPVSETGCNGRTVPTGELFDFDITAFKEMPPHVRSEIRAMNQTVVVSEIRHHIGPHRARCKVVHGYVVANSSDRRSACTRPTLAPSLNASSTPSFPSSRMSTRLRPHKEP